MRTFTIDSVTVTAPDAFQFAFGLIPIICEWSTNNVAYIHVDINTPQKAYADDRTPIYRNGQYMAIFDISPYVRAAMSDDPQPFATSSFTNLTRAFNNTITVYYTDNTYTVGTLYQFTAIWGAVNTNEVFNGDTIVHYWPNYPSIITAYINSGASNTTITHDITSGVTPATYTSTKTGNGITYLPITSHGQVADTITITSPLNIKYVLDPDNGIVAASDAPTVKTIKVIKHTGNCSGIFLRWVDRSGLSRGWVFKEGKTQYAVSNESTSLRNDIEFGAVNNYNGVGIVVENKTANNRLTLCYVNATQDDIKILKTLLSSPIVEAHINGYYVRVTVATGTTSFSQANYQNFEITIVLPQEEVQRL